MAKDGSRSPGKFPSRFDWDATPPPELRGGIVCIGNFDGVHLGHAALLRHARSVVPVLPVVAVTFDPHPLQLLAPDRYKPALTEPDQRARFLIDAGADQVAILRTVPELLNQKPRAFFERVIRDGFQARAVVEGEDFRFGKDRAGDNQDLQAMCEEIGIAFSICPPFSLDGEVISSSRIRDALTRGDIPRATRLQGRHYVLSGRVVEGQQRGRTLGIPTANLDHVPTLIPAEGVYAVWAWVDDIRYPAAANIGPNPTFGEQERKLEVHLIGFAGDLYGSILRVEFVERLRETRPFGSVEDLLNQVRSDIAQVEHRLREGETP